MRQSVALSMALALIMGCAQSPPSPSAPDRTTAHPIPPASSLPAASPAARATEPVLATPPPEPQPAGPRWEEAASMHTPRLAPNTVLLGGGRVLVVGDYSNAAIAGIWGPPVDVPDRSRFAEIWVPATNRWMRTSPLPEARVGAVAVALPDGRALVLGGLDEGYESFASAYLFDPATERWTATGRMRTPRTDPAVAVLKDGRVLVAGGIYWSGWRPLEGDADASLAGYRLANDGPSADGRELATAELYDPATGRWSKTGSMRYARWSPTAVTLGDGRVLVSDEGNRSEVYDPDSGRFKLAPALPSVDNSALQRAGAPPEVLGTDPCNARVLVGVPDGVVAIDASCPTRHESWIEDPIVRQSFRLDVGTGRWEPLGDLYVVWSANGQDLERGTDHQCGIATTLRDGRVLCAGGLLPDDDVDGSRQAWLLDTGTGRWSSLPEMPEARVIAAVVALPDGGALLAGGTTSADVWPTVGLTDAYRFVPETR